MPSLKPWSAAARKAAASSTRATRRPAASGAMSIDADTGPSYALGPAPKQAATVRDEREAEQRSDHDAVRRGDLRQPDGDRDERERIGGELVGRELDQV